jgi:hypothetical protein
MRIRGESGPHGRYLRRAARVVAIRRRLRSSGLRSSSRHALAFRSAGR